MALALGCGGADDAGGTPEETGSPCYAEFDNLDDGSVDRYEFAERRDGVDRVATYPNLSDPYPDKLVERRWDDGRVVLQERYARIDVAGGEPEYAVSSRVVCTYADGTYRCEYADADGTVGAVTELERDADGRQIRLSDDYDADGVWDQEWFYQYRGAGALADPDTVEWYENGSLSETWTYSGTKSSGTLFKQIKAASGSLKGDATLRYDANYNLLSDVTDYYSPGFWTDTYEYAWDSRNRQTMSFVSLELSQIVNRTRKQWDGCQAPPVGLFSLAVRP